MLAVATAKELDADTTKGCSLELPQQVPEPAKPPPATPELGTTEGGEDSVQDDNDNVGGSSEGSDDESGSEPLINVTGALPSIGSALHASGKCSRCCFYLKNRCRNGVNCQFCHLPHERRSRGRGCRGHGTSKSVEGEIKEAAVLPGLRPPPGLVAQAAPPGLSILPPVEISSPEGFARMNMLAYSQPPTPQGVPMMPARMAMSLPSTPSGAIPGRCLARTSAPPLLPPSAPPRGLPEDDDKAPPPPENSPGGPQMRHGPLPPMTSTPAPLGEAGRSMNKLASTPAVNSGGALLSTQPPRPAQAEKKPSPPAPELAQQGPPGTFFHKGTENFRPAPPTTPPSLTPLLGTVPTSYGGSLPRLLGSRGPPGLTHPKDMKPEAAPAPAAEIQRLTDAQMLQPNVPEEVGTLSTNPLKVFMPEYDTNEIAPSLDPWMPAKKRLPSGWAQGQV